MGSPSAAWIAIARADNTLTAPPFFSSVAQTTADFKIRGTAAARGEAAPGTLD
jgi:hypothetical protein